MSEPKQEAKNELVYSAPEIIEIKLSGVTIHGVEVESCGTERLDPGEDLG